MDFEAYLNTIKKNFGKSFKSSNASLELNTVDKELPPTGLVLDNPLLEYAFDRRFMAYGRCYLVYGKKGCSKTSFLFDLAKLFQRNGGKFFWIETENAPDFRYMEQQGVDPRGVIYHNPKSIEEALTLCKITIENYAKFSDGKTPILVALDSLAGGATEYEKDQDVIGQNKPGEHAKLMAAFYRHIIPYLECENMMFVATNQLREQIGGMAGFGPEKPEALIGGEAQRFNSTYQFKVTRIKDILASDHMGVKRKSGSTHTLVVKRNKLGREGNSQKIEFDLNIKGGLDYNVGLIRKLGEDYPSLVSKLPLNKYSWDLAGYEYVIGDEERRKDPIGTERALEILSGAAYGLIDPSQKYKEIELGVMLQYSHPAKETIRAAFGIPDMPAASVVEEIEKVNKTKRKRKSELEIDTETTTSYEDAY
jgi:RecA/RadA recombinase